MEYVERVCGKGIRTRDLGGTAGIREVTETIWEKIVLRCI